jgi:hypothetical protein
MKSVSAQPANRDAAPPSSRPSMPTNYGILAPTSGTGLLPWSHVGERMASARNYWIGTTRPDGRPHVIPVWGVWTNATFYFGTDKHSRKARNLASNPALVVHLESGDDVVILEGTATEVIDPAVLVSIDDAYFAKYQVHLLGHAGGAVIYALQPHVALAWQESDFPGSATRWRYGGGEAGALR